MNTKALVLMLALAAAPLSAAPARATTVLQVDVPDMTVTSEWVVRARVVGVRWVDLRPQGGGLFTDVDLSVTEVYRGAEVPARYTLRMVGGRGADGIELRIPGMPTFVAGEDVVLFLEKTSVGHVPCGLGQGVWRVAVGPDGQAWVRQSTGGVHLMRRDAQGRLAHAEPALMSDARPLGELVRDIYLAQQAPPTP